MRHWEKQMKWLSKLFGGKAMEPETPDPPFDAKWKDPHGPQIHWAGFEVALTELIETEISRFAEVHKGEVFYGFALDCNAEYCDVLFCLNSTTGLHETATAYHTKNPQNSLEAEMDSLRWGLGDWKYQGFNFDAPEWESRYKAALPVDGELSIAEDINEFLETACRALVRAERAGVFAKLNLTEDFRVACIDHDENILEGDLRLDQVRANTS